MKRIITTLIVLATFTGVSYGQCVDSLFNYFFRTYQLNLNGIQGQGGYVSGSNDITLEVGNNYDFGQGQVTGVFIWWGAKEIVNTADSLTLSVYATGADSLPVGARLGSMKVSTNDVDTAFTGNVLDDASYYQFPNPINVNGRFAVTIEVDGASIDDTLGVLANAQGDGLGEGRAILKAVNGAWFHFYEIWTFGGGDAYDADLMMFPTVVTDFSANAVSSTPNVCPGGSVTLSSEVFACTENYTVEWTGSGVNNPFNPTTTANIAQGATGTLTYTLTVIDVDNNDTITRSVNVTVRNVGIDAGTDQTIACATTADLSATTSGTTGAGTTIAWSNGNTGLNNFGVTAGTYSVTVTNQFGCTATDDVVVSFPTSQDVDFSVDAVRGTDTVDITTNGGAACAGLAIIFTNESDIVNGWNWTWTFGDADSSFTTTTDASFVYTATNNYTVTLTGDSAGCEISTTRSFLVLPATNSACIVGITEISEYASLVDIFPNPNSGSFSVDFSAINSDKVNVKVFNMVGEQVYNSYDFSVNNTAVKNVSLGDAANGIYFVRVEIDGEAFTKKINVTK